jgi:hypothetical protein
MITKTEMIRELAADFRAAHEAALAAIEELRAAGDQTVYRHEDLRDHLADWLADIGELEHYGEVWEYTCRRVHTDQ